MKFYINNLSLNHYLISNYPHLYLFYFYNFNKMIYCNFKSTKEKKSFYQNKKLEMLNFLRDSLERKIASVTASIEVLEKQIKRDTENTNN